jgi:hypothetical protein
MKIRVTELQDALSRLPSDPGQGRYWRVPVMPRISSLPYPIQPVPEKAEVRYFTFEREVFGFNERRWTEWVLVEAPDVTSPER